MVSTDFKHSLVFVFFFFVAVALAVPGGAHACTVWAAAGDKTASSGTLLAKNRDRTPQRSELRVFTPTTGFRYFGLFQVKGHRDFPVAGINEKGLALVSTTASSIPRQYRTLGGKNLNEKILTGFRSVDAVLENKEVFYKSLPVFYIIADNSKTASIEVAPNGEFSIKVEDNGVLYHTNHFTDPKLLWANEKLGKSSLTRFDRIRNLLATHGPAFSLEDFILFSEDQHDGPDDSIWRTGSEPGKERTLATWIVSIPKDSPATVYVKLANPDQPVKKQTFTLDQTFWTDRSRSVVLSLQAGD
jgi:isopenicillin-N N-acyltransferase-like protein